MVKTPDFALLDPSAHARTADLLQRYPAPDMPGVDLAWHIDRALTYVFSVVDRDRDFIPYYRGCIYLEPRKLVHAEWDVPHCVGRLLDVAMMWEQTFGRRVKDEQYVQKLRALLFGSLSPEDDLAHFPTYCRESEEIDWHSQREVLLALLGLHRQRDDTEALDHARRLVHGYHAKSDHAGFPVDTAWSGRFIEALLAYHRVTRDPLALDMAKRFADDFHDRFFDDAGTFPRPGNNQSHIQTLAELIEFGLYTNQSRYIDKARRIIDGGLWQYRSKYGLFFEGDGPRGETNCCGDLIKAEIMLGLNGHPKYFDDAERILRNHMLASQYLDPRNAQGTTAVEQGLTDTANEVYTDAPERALGGFAFTLPNDLIDPSLWEVTDVPADMVGGVTHGMIAAWRHIVTRNDRGVWVNFLLSKETPELSIRSHMPVEGLIEIAMRVPDDLFVRIPAFVEVDRMGVEVDGIGAPRRLFGPYLHVPKQTGTNVTIRFDQTRRIEEETICGTTYRVEWLGDTVWDVSPAGEHVPLYSPARLALHGLPPDA